MYFVFHDTVPQPKNRSARINPKLLTTYALYRNALIDSYRKKPDLSQDIRTKPEQFKPDQAFTKIMSNAGYTADEKGLYQNSVAAALDTMQRWKDDANEHMKSFVAYQKVDGKENIVGFVLFQDKIVRCNEPAIYIAEAGVAKQGTGIGRRLMECVLSHFPAGTEFLIGTRVFNTEAKTLYQDRLGFTPLNADEVQELLGLNKERYIGFKHTSNEEELGATSKKMKLVM